MFGGDSPLGYVKNKVLLHNYIIKQNDSTKQDYNLERFFPSIFLNIWRLKSVPLNILNSAYSPESRDMGRDMASKQGLGISVFLEEHLKNCLAQNKEMPTLKVLETPDV